MGTKGFQSSKFISFINQYSFEKIYIVGDFVDIWLLKKRLYWNQEHTDVIRKILKRSKKSDITFIVGNHDEFCCNFFGQFGNIEICNCSEYITVNNKKLLIIHGHQFDYVTKYAKWLSVLGSLAYSVLVSLNLILDNIRHKMKFKKHWSLSSYVKKNIKNAVAFIFNFERALSTFAKTHKYDGVICGHIHTPTIKKIDNIYYLNTGDWVESCTAIMENYNGEIQLINFWNNKTEIIQTLNF